MNMVTAYASMALTALIGVLFFKFLDWREGRNKIPAK